MGGDFLFGVVVLAFQAEARHHITPAIVHPNPLTASGAQDTSPFANDHKWRTQEDCTPLEVERNTQSMVGRGWWRPNMTWLLSTPPPGPDCLYARVYKRGVAPWWIPSPVFDAVDEVAVGLEASGSGLEHYIPKGFKHWGIVYHYRSQVHITDVCLNVCDVRDDVSYGVYKGRLAFMTLMDPWPMDLCVWTSPTSDLNKDGLMEPLTDTKYDCGLMWKAQSQVWQEWQPKTYSAGNQCQHIIKKTLAQYDTTMV